MIIYIINKPFLYPHTQRVTELTIVELAEDYTKLFLFFPLLKVLNVQFNSQTSTCIAGLKSLFEVFASLNSPLKEIHFCLDYTHGYYYYNTSDVSDIFKQLQACPINHTIKVAFREGNHEFPTFSQLVSSKVECLHLSWLTFIPDFTHCKVSNCLKRLKIDSCTIPDDACTTLYDFFQSLYNVS